MEQEVTREELAIYMQRRDFERKHDIRSEVATIKAIEMPNGFPCWILPGGRITKDRTEGTRALYQIGLILMNWDKKAERKKRRGRK